jgi:PPOX class probable F420-dependent enzyme
MPSSLPETHKDLLSKTLFAHLGTAMPDGQPQVTPVWFDYDGKTIVVNTAVGRQKDRNMQRDGRVALSIIDADNPYRYLEVRGSIVERTEQGADAVIDHLAKKYLNVDSYPYRQPGEKRVTYKIKPEHFTTQG